MSDSTGAAGGAPRLLHVERLTAAAFARFGEVIEPAAAARSMPINDGTALRRDALARIDTAGDQGRTTIAIVTAQPRTLPFDVHMLERHPLGSQAWLPLDPRLRFLVVVADDPQAQPRAFLASGGQGVNYRRGTWHHPLLALDAVGDFLVIDREGPGANCDEAMLPTTWRIEAQMP